MTDPPPLLEGPALCPVACLKCYLRATSHFSDGQIFRGDEGCKLSLNHISAQLLCFLQTAVPNSVLRFMLLE